MQESDETSKAIAELKSIALDWEKNKKESFAEKLFHAIHVQSCLEEDIFDKVNEILGSNISECSKPGFVFEADDVFFDYYDNSIEVIRPANREFMTREQANQILDLGFSIVYESCGENGRCWNRDSYGSCSVRKAGENLKLKAEIKILREKLNK